MVTNRSSDKFDPAEPKTWHLLLTIGEASRVLRVSSWTLRKWDRDGILKPIRLGSRKDRRYRKKDILKITEEGV